MVEVWTLDDLKDKYKIDFKKIISEVDKPEIKRVLLQFPDGLKPYATAIVDDLEDRTGKEFFIWLGSCFGACDYPVGVERLNIDLMIQIGHNSLMPGYLTA